MYGHVRCWTPATRVTDSCEFPCGCQELHLGPLEEQLLLVTVEPSPSPSVCSLGGKTVFLIIVETVIRLFAI